ncbi:hypothetical protein REPUB_Repub11eG0050000 [Reevesia pubescens]
MQQQKYLAIALDQTRDQVEAILKVNKPDIIFYDFGYWIPSLARQIGIKAIYYGVVSSMSHGLSTKKVAKEMSVEELIELPLGYPYSKVRIKAEEVDVILFKAEDFGIGLSFQDRIRTSVKERPCLPEIHTKQLEEKWVNWLSKFEPSSIVFCSLGSENTLGKEEFQELLLGFELSGLPFLIALKPPQGCLTIEEALPEGFQDRVQGRGLVHGGWVPQEQLLSHPSIGCFVNHCGYGTMWEFSSDQ